MGYALYYKDVKFDPVSQAVIIDGEQNSDWWDESVIHCLSQNNNISCPIVTYRSRTRCIVEKFVSLHKLKFVHFASNQNLEVTRISPKTFHGVLYQKDSEVGRKSKVFQRYQKTKVQVKCGLSLLGLGTSPHTTELNITLKNLTNNLHVLDPLEKLAKETSRYNERVKIDLHNISRSLVDLDNDANLKIGNITFVNLKQQKMIIILLTLVVVGGITIFACIKIKNKIKNFWRTRYNQTSDRFAMTRLSNRNIRTQIETSN